MLSKEANERITRVGPGTPMGELMRRYWHPIAASVELQDNPVKKVRILGEDLVLYRDRSGNLGLIDEPCPHRRVSMEYGIPEQEGLRCPYHGWLFNHEGRCLEQPAEPWNSTFKDRITTKAYNAQELGGLVFAYLGPQPAPLLPRYDILVWENVVRHIGVVVIPCNWVQCMENSMDPVHTEYLHGRFMEYQWARRGWPVDSKPGVPFRHTRIGFDRFEHGLIKRRMVEGSSREDDLWGVGHPVIFPHILRRGAIDCNYAFQYRVPIDDTHTYHVSYEIYRPGIPIPPQESIPLYDIPWNDEQGNMNLQIVMIQDALAWVTQGSIAQRDKEHLAQTDAGVILYRQLLEEQLQRVERGEDPMEVYRNPAENQCIDLPQEGIRYGDRLRHPLAPKYRSAYFRGQEVNYSPIIGWIGDLFEEADRRAAGGDPLIPYTDQPDIPIVGDWHREVELRPTGQAATAGESAAELFPLSGRRSSST
ncbi:MAG: aromatic ring-hydroxylating dioxygenase subunit alpha [Dehalococcoidia bacterium]|nr:aromatic ring-hydroxylating dioxygenase subunit alpha [Dehalococcoidia bacterium]